MQEIITAISTVGFPIVMSLLLYIKIDKQDQAHREEMNRMTDAIQNNTLALQHLADQLGGSEL